MKTPLYIAFLAVLALGACAPDTPGAQAARARHEHMEELGAAFKTLRDEAEKTSPDGALMAQKAVEVAEAAESMAAWFSAGSGPQDGVKTKAKGDVWEKPMEFAEEIRLLRVQTEEMKAAADDGPAAIGAQIRDVGARCKSCHDQYREE